MSKLKFAALRRTCVLKKLKHMFVKGGKISDWKSVITDGVVVVVVNVWNLFVQKGLMRYKSSYVIA